MEMSEIIDDEVIVDAFVTALRSLFNQRNHICSRARAKILPLCELLAQCRADAWRNPVFDQMPELLHDSPVFLR
jgi:hypothetical protein